MLAYAGGCFKNQFEMVPVGDKLMSMIKVFA